MLHTNYSNRAPRPFEFPQGKLSSGQALRCVRFAHLLRTFDSLMNHKSHIGFCSNFPFNRPAMSERSESNGGGGIRTPVPRCFKTSFYMHSRFIIFFASLSAKRQAQKLAISVFLAGVGPNNRLGQSAIWRPYQTHRQSPAGRAAKLSSHLQLIVAN